MARWQYQQFAEIPPVSAGSWLESITIDKWLPIFVDHNNRKPILTGAILAGSIFGTIYVAAPIETITIDKWKPIFPDILSTKKEFPEIGHIVCQPIVSEPIYVDKWKPEFIDYYRSIPTQPRTLRGDSLAEILPSSLGSWEENVTCDKWMPHFINYYYIRPTISRNILSGSLVEAIHEIIPAVQFGSNSTGSIGKQRIRGNIGEQYITGVIGQQYTKGDT